MALLRNITVVITFCTLLGACGFRPVYDGGNSEVRNAFNMVYIENISEREGQYLRNTLMDRFYQSGRPHIDDTAFILHISGIRESITDLDITKSSDATRAQLKLQTQMALKDRNTNKIVLKRDLLAITSYNILRSQFTTHVSEENARENALNELANKIERQLSLYFNRPFKLVP